VANWDDVRRIVAALPETREESRAGGQLSWRVKDKSLAWERPLRKGDIAALGDAAPDGDILGVRVPDLGAKEALLADNDGAIFTIPHFDNYPAVLVEMDKVEIGELEELIVEAWLSRAPAKLVKAYLAESESDS
jgi:hypothetical protein